MSETTNLKLFKHDNPSTNTDLFDIDKSLNQNWDKIDAIDEKIETNKIKCNDLQNQINVEKARIDNITNLPEGSTSGDAELQDIRIGANCTTYNTAGNAVRQQFLDTNYTISGLLAIQKYDYKQIDNVIVSNDYRWKTYNNKVEAENYTAVNFMCKGNQKYKCVGLNIGHPGGAYTIHFIDKDGNRISYINDYTSHDTIIEFTTPENCAEVRYTVYKNDNYNSQELYQPVSLVEDIEKLNAKSYIIVDKNGNGNYTEIQDAIDNCNDSSNNHVTLLIMPRSI